MTHDPENNDPDDVGLRSIYDVDPPAEEDLWFLPAPADDGQGGDLPWTGPDQVGAREQGFAPQVWRQAEAHKYRALIAAAQAVARFGERIRAFPDGIAERFALASVAAVMRGEGVWLSVEKIALFRAMRVASDDTAQDLARAAWAVRRLSGANRAGGPLAGLHGFLGRTATSSHATSHTGGALDPERPVGDDLDGLSRDWLAALAGLEDCHPLTRAGFAFALWRVGGVTPHDEVLEPSVAAMLIGAGGLAAFLPISEGQSFDRKIPGVGATDAAARLEVFYAAVEAGALKALMDLDRLGAWQVRADRLVQGLSGRTPALLANTLLRVPVVSAELAAHETGCSRAAARRNLHRFAKAGLVREVTGQDRYRFWAIRM